MPPKRTSRGRSSARASVACQYCKEKRVRCDGGPNRACTQCLQRQQPCLFGTSIDRRRSDFRALVSAFANQTNTSRLPSTTTAVTEGFQVASSSSSSSTPAQLSSLGGFWPSPTPSQLADAEQMLDDYRAWTSNVDPSRAFRISGVKRSKAEPVLIESTRDTGTYALSVNESPLLYKVPDHLVELTRSSSSTQQSTSASSDTKKKRKRRDTKGRPRTSSESETSFASLSTHGSMKSTASDTLQKVSWNRLIKGDHPIAEIETPLVQTFFDCLGEQFPFLSPKDLDTPSALLDNAVCSLAARYSTEEVVVRGRLSMERYTFGLEFADKAKSLLLPLLAAPSRDVVIGLLLLAWHDFSIGSEAGTWMYSGMASRMAFDLGLQKEGLKNEEAVERERNRALFSSIYCLENILSLRNGRRPSIRPQDFQYTSSSISTPFTCFVRLMGHAGRISDLMNDMQSLATKGIALQALDGVAETIKNEYTSLSSPLQEEGGMTSQLQLHTFALLCFLDTHGVLSRPFKEWSAYSQLEATVSGLKKKTELHRITPFSCQAWLMIAQQELSQLLESTYLPLDETTSLHLKQSLQSYLENFDGIASYWSSANGVKANLIQFLQNRGMNIESIGGVGATEVVVTMGEMLGLSRMTTPSNE